MEIKEYIVAQGWFKNAVTFVTKGTTLVLSTDCFYSNLVKLSSILFSIKKVTCAAYKKCTLSYQFNESKKTWCRKKNKKKNLKLVL